MLTGYYGVLLRLASRKCVPQVNTSVLCTSSTIKTMCVRVSNVVFSFSCSAGFAHGFEQPHFKRPGCIQRVKDGSPNMFQQYEAELQEVLADAEAKLGALLAASEHADRGAAVCRLNDVVRTARDLEKQIDVEVRSAPSEARDALRARATTLSDRLQSLRRQAEAVAEEAEREAVLGVRNPLNASHGARSRLANAGDRARGQNDLIRGALETVHDTEQTAIDIADELGRNRETIGNIRGHVADAGGDLGAARGLIGRMQRREVQQKAVLTLVAAMLIGAIGTVSYYSFS